MPQKKAPKLKMLTLFLLISVSVFQTGCVRLLTGQSKVVFVPESNGMVRLGDDVEGHVYTYEDDSWVRSPNKVKLPEGWYAGSIDADEE